MEDASPTIAAARCPRCRYDQRGPISTWRESCPLTGTCTECGLEFIWSEILLPEKFEPRWCVEFVPRARSVPWASVRTFVRSLWPWAFWSRLKMSQPIRPWRLAMFAGQMLLPFVLLYLIIQVGVAIYIHARCQRLVQQEYQQAPFYIQVNQAQLSVLKAAEQVHTLPEDEREEAIGPLAEQLGMHPSYLRSKVDMAPEVVTSNIQVWERHLASRKAMYVAPPVLSHSAWAAMYEAVFFPYRGFSKGFIQYADGTMFSYPAPVELHEIWWSDRTFQPFEFDTWVLGACSSLISAAVLLILLPASFILLPFSRRRAKVRWPHIWRIFVYSIPLFMLVLIAFITAAVLLALDKNAQAFRLARNAPLYLWLILPIWWSVAMSRYLKLQHAPFIVVSLTFMLALIASPLLIQAVPLWLERLILG